jgi:hypothetical protein
MKIKLKFMPGCFDNFEGTQEDLDQLMQIITEMAETGELIDDILPLEEELYYVVPRTLH